MYCTPVYTPVNETLCSVKHSQNCFIPIFKARFGVPGVTRSPWRLATRNHFRRITQLTASFQISAPLPAPPCFFEIKCLKPLLMNYSVRSQMTQGHESRGIFKSNRRRVMISAQMRQPHGTGTGERSPKPKGPSSHLTSQTTSVPRENQHRSAARGFDLFQLYFLVFIKKKKKVRAVTPKRPYGRGCPLTKSVT